MDLFLYMALVMFIIIFGGWWWVWHSATKEENEDE